MKKLFRIFFISTILISIVGIRAFDKEKNLKEISSDIDKVVVYGDRALVSRITKIKNLNSGIHELQIKNLPTTVIDDSVRAETLSGNALKILDVQVKTYKQKKIPDKKLAQLKDDLTELQEQQRKINDKIQALNFMRDYLTKLKSRFLYGALAQKNHTTGNLMFAEKISIADADKMMSYLAKKYEQNSLDIQKQEYNKRLLDKKILYLQSKMSELNINMSALPQKKLVKVTVKMANTGNCKLKISYINTNYLKPGYDIRVIMDKKRTEFTGYGVVSQKSGEDWSGVKLAFSTASPAISGYLPDLEPLYASINNILPDFIQKNKLGETNSFQDKKNKNKAGSLVFHVPQKADIPSDNSPHRTRISHQSFPVNFEYIAVPKLSPYTFLQVVGSNTMDAPILSGDLNIFIGNNFVGSSYTDNILPGEDFELTLNVEENVRVTRTLESKDEKSSGLLNNDLSTTYAFAIKVENYTGKDIVMNVMDQIPVSQSDDIEISDVEFNISPQKRKKGIMKWRLKMKPKEVKTIQFTFKISIPKDKLALLSNTKSQWKKAKVKGYAPLMDSLQNADELQEESNIRQNGAGKVPAMRNKMW